jgi:hypothetical protein
VASAKITPWLVGLVLPFLQSPTRTPLQRLQAKIDVVSVANLTPLQVAGQFNNPSEEQNKRMPPMGKASLFLFPDKTYIYTFVTDISPEMISDKGTWTLDRDVIQLKSSQDVTWKQKRAGRRYILVRRRDRDDELFAVGLDSDLLYFESHAKDDLEFMFLLTSLKREKTISAADAAPLRAKLMKEKWMPEFYR